MGLLTGATWVFEAACAVVPSSPGIRPVKNKTPARQDDGPGFRLLGGGGYTSFFILDLVMESPMPLKMSKMAKPYQTVYRR